MKLTIEIEMDGDVFEYARDSELQRLFDIVRTYVATHVEPCKHTLLDSNGNRTGKFKISRRYREASR